MKPVRTGAICTRSVLTCISHLSGQGSYPDSFPGFEGGQLRGGQGSHPGDFPLVMLQDSVSFAMTTSSYFVLASALGLTPGFATWIPRLD